MSTSKQDYASSHSEERWRIARRFPPTVTNPISPRDNSPRVGTSAAEAVGKPPFSLVPLKFLSPLPRISEIFFVTVGQRSDQESLRGITARQVGKKDASTARAREPDVRNAPNRKPITSAKAFPNLTLTTRPGNGLGTSPPTGVDTQGPPPVDYSLELEAEFPTEMEIEM